MKIKKEEEEEKEKEEGMQQRLYGNQSLQYLLPGLLQRRCVDYWQAFRVYVFTQAVPTACNPLPGFYWLSVNSTHP